MFRNTHERSTTWRSAESRSSPCPSSRPREVARGSETVTTGIFKEPVDGRVMLGTLNLDGDGQADLVGHGGIYKAAYAYPVEHYEYWKRELGREDLTFGQFGENFTVEGMTEDEVHIGDAFRVGGAVVEVTQPRVPCYKLGLKMGLKGFEKTFLASCRVGYYLRVLQEGEVGVGDPGVAAIVRGQTGQNRHAAHCARRPAQ